MKLNEHLARARLATLPRRIALISDHASPLAPPGSIDCGGQNVYVANLARELALAGALVDVFTRRDAPGQKQLVQLCEGVRPGSPTSPAS
jgi:D-inositol-3-phosphate glycosyltransferase